MTPPVVRQLHASLMSRTPDQAIAVLQEAGYAAGEGLYQAFAAVNNPTDLDADLLGETLSEFFKSGGWGAGASSPLGTGGPPPGATHLGADETRAPPTPTCFFFVRLLAALP